MGSSALSAGTGCVLFSTLLGVLSVAIPEWLADYTDAKRVAIGLWNLCVSEFCLAVRDVVEIKDNIDGKSKDDSVIGIVCKYYINKYRE